MKALIFDFDGTIVDSLQAVFTIANRLSLEFGYPSVAAEEIYRLKDLSSREVLKQSGVSLFRLPFLLQRLRTEMNREIAHLNPIPGIQPALQQLRVQGYLLGIATSNSRENVLAFLEAQGMTELFTFVDAGLTVFGKGRIIRRSLRRYDLAPVDVAYVGDETRDIEAARKVGIPVISVSWGFNSAQALARQKPDFLIHKPQELVAVAEKLWALNP